MRFPWLVSLSMVAIVGCSQSNAPPTTVSAIAPSKPAPSENAPSENAPAHVLTGTFGDCNMDCRFDFRELAAPSPRVVQRYCRNADPSCIAFEGTLTPVGRAKLQASGEALARAKLEPVYGCGKCVDGSDNTLTLQHADGSTTEHSYDANHSHPEAPPELDATHPILQSLENALRTCVSNELVQVAADCTPYDKVTPRPHSRP